MTRGVLGGSFDPPHLGHLVLADQCASALDLQRVCFIPAYQPPHKPAGGVTAFDLRAEMLEAAVSGDPRFRVLSIERERGGISYTVETLRGLHESYADDLLWLLMGQDSLEDLVHWRNPEEIVALARVGVYRREGVTGAVPEFLRERVRFVEGPRVDVSSSEIRRRLREGLSVRHFVPEPVLDVIRREGLYGSRDQ